MIENAEQKYRALIEDTEVALSLFTGIDMIVEIANDLMIDFWGKGKSVFGKPLAEVLPELEGQPFFQILNDVYTTGVPFNGKAIPAHLVVGGVLDTYYFDISYKAVRDGSGKIYGVTTTAMDVTENIKLENKVDETQQRMLSSFEELPLGLAIITGEELVFTMVNSFYATLTGRSAAELVGKSLISAMPELEEQGFDKALRKVMATGEPLVSKEAPVNIYRNGKIEIIHIDYIYQPHYKDADGKIISILVIVNDVTEQILSRKRLEESESRFRLLIEDAPVAMSVSKGRDCVVEIANGHMFEIWNKKPEDVLNRSIFDAIPEAPGQGFEKILNDIFDTGEPFAANEIPITLYKNDTPQLLYLNVVYKPIKDDKGIVSGIMQVAIDVTEGVRSRKQVEESETKLKTIIAAAPAGIALFVGRDLVIEEANQTFIDILGRGPGIIGLPFREAMPELITEDQVFLKILDDVYTSGIPFTSPAALAKVVQNGVLNDNYYNLSYTPIRNASGEIYAILDIAIDVTEQVRAQIKVEESEARFRTMAEGTHILVGVGDESSNATYLNHAWAELTGRPIEELLKFGWADLIHPEDKERHVNLYLDAFKARIPFTSDFRVLAHDGEYRWLHSRSSVRLNSDGVFAGYISSCVDITEQIETRKRVEKAVVERTRELADSNIKLKRSNEELEQFAYIASHDLQEPIRKISTFTQMLEHSIQDKSEKSKDYFSKIYSSTDRMTNLVRDVLAYSRIKEESNFLETVDLNEIVETLKIDFELQIDETQTTIETIDLPMIHAISSQMTQLFGNLMSNSLKYHKVGVKPIIKISASIAKLEKVAERLVLDQHNTYYHIQFSDNGIGFDKDHVEKIFRIFQRLHGKTEFEGTGIGLAICNRIVQNHKGHISAAVGENGGAMFNILLPKN